MKRIQLFEFEDFSWFPNWLREDMTNYLVVFHRMGGTTRHLAPLLARLCRAAKTSQIIDLCSGGTGPMQDTLRTLREEQGLPEARLTFTDLYPNLAAARKVEALGDPGIQYRTTPVDATQVDPSLQGVRSMVCSFHHMRPEGARKILGDAWQKKQPICIFEISDNSAPFWLWPLAVPLGFMFTLLLMPWARPFSLRVFFFTYLIPLLPLVIAWDGATSNARTYTANDLRELTAPLKSPDYEWEIGTVKSRIGPMLYLLGIPKPA